MNAPLATPRTAFGFWFYLILWVVLTVGTPGQVKTADEASDQLLDKLHGHLRSESYAEAVEILRTWVSRDPSNAALHNLLGATLERAGHPDRSPASYLRALQLNPTWSGVRLNLALNYLRLNQTQAAAGQFARLVRSRSPARLFPSFYNQAPIGPELEHFARTLGSDPDQYLSLGGVLLVHELPEAASAVFTVGVEVLPDSGQLQEALGRSQLKLKRFRAAERAFKKALEIDPDSEGSCLHLGYAQASQGLVSRAQTTYRECIRKKPADYAGHYFLGFVLLEEGPDRSEEAISHLKEALRFNSRSVNSRFLLGKAYVASKRPQAALSAFQAVVQAEPENEAALFHLGTLQRKLGHKKEAQETLERFQRLKSLKRRRSRQPLLFSRSNVDSMETSKLVREVSTFYARYKRFLIQEDYQEIWNLLTRSSQALYADFEQFKALAEAAYRKKGYRERIKASQLQGGNAFSGRIFCQLVTAAGTSLPPLVLSRQGSELKIDYAFDLSLAGLRSLGGR